MATNTKTVFVIGVLAVAIAGAASYSLWTYLKGQEAKVKTAVATSPVVVAKEDIPAGATISGGQVRVSNWPQAELPKGEIYTAPEQVAGRVAIERFVPGEPINGAKLVPKEGQAGIMTYKIPDGHRAMTVAVDQVAGVAGFITPGNKVDVVLTTAQPGSGQQVSKIVLQNMPVLAVGQIIAEQQKDGKPQVVPTVTMDVTPEDAEKLAIASTQGRLQLVLRKAGDAEVAKTTGATVAKVMTGAVTTATKVVYKTKEVVKPVIVEKEKPRPVEKPSEPYNIEVYRGTQKSVESFKAQGQ